MEYINITEKRYHKGSIHLSSSSDDESCTAEKILDIPGYWSTKKRSAPIKEFVVINYEEPVPVDSFRIKVSQKGPSVFPGSFRIEGSMNAEEWCLLYSESNTSLEVRDYDIVIPLTVVKYIKFVITEPAVSGSQYFSEIGLFEAGINGALGISASSWSSGNGAENLIKKDNRLCWESELKSNSSNEFVNIDLGKVCSINRVILGSSTEGFPENFHVETSIDNEVWITLFYEKGFEAENNKRYFWNTGITAARYVRFEAAGKQFVNRKFGIRIAEVSVFSALELNDHTHNIGNITPHASIFNAGMVRLARDGESLPGAVVQSSDSRLRDASNVFKGIVRFANDGESSPGLAVQSDDKRIKPASELKPGIVRLAYNRETNPDAVVQSNDSRLQHAGEDNFGIVKICPDGEYKEHSVVSGNDVRLQKGTTLSHGICILASDGENLQGAVVQGNDRRLKDATRFSKGIVRIAEDGEIADDAVPAAGDKRLKDATTGSKGIVELAEDGEDSASVVVQGNDRRLKDATSETKGIVELAEDGEERPGVAVQGNDRRLKDATTDNKGIVELAEDGEERPGVAVQGNDRRLKDATSETRGIVELAEDGEEKPGVVVQGNDRRLKDATETSKGIMKFAPDGDEEPLSAVQGNDKRLRKATTISCGIVELAEDGEDSAGVVVQGNDKRLQNSTEDSYGIVRLARNGESGSRLAVQADDARLANSREPLPHSHEYAPLNHSYSSHKGTISIRESRSESFKDITPPSDGSSVIYGNNTSSEGPSIGITGISGNNEGGDSYGVLGHSNHVGVRGQASGRGGAGAGVLGASRFGAGGVFASEHGFSLVADGSGALIRGYDKNLNMMGNGKALLVKGSAEFQGRITIKGEYNKEGFPAGFVELFEVDEVEYVSPGDILVASDKGGALLSRSRKSYSTSVVGVVSGNPYISINNSGKEEKVYPVALTGKVLCKVDARNNPVNPGDLIVASDVAGCGMAGRIDSFDKIGSVIGKALERLEDGVDLIPVFITHQ